LHVVTDDDVLARPDFAANAEAVLRCGSGVALHLRGPSIDAGTLLRLAVRLRPVAVEADSVLLVNDRVDVAMEARLDGVHLGRRSMPVGAARRILPPHALVGASVHDPERAREAWSEGADYLIVGTIFSTPSHPGRTGDGTIHLKRVGASGVGPLIAIGGVTVDRLAACIRAGAHGVATLRGVWDSEDPAAWASTYLDRIADLTEPIE
jgi:thiamine-phosphate pyrophosphorylase